MLASRVGQAWLLSTASAVFFLFSTIHNKHANTQLSNFSLHIQTSIGKLHSDFKSNFCYFFFPSTTSSLRRRVLKSHFFASSTQDTPLLSPTLCDAFASCYASRSSISLSAPYLGVVTVAGRRYHPPSWTPNAPQSCASSLKT